jgi:hypothetical protein
VAVQKGSTGGAFGERSESRAGFALMGDILPYQAATVLPIAGPGVRVPDAGQAARVEIAVTAIGADGTVLRAVVETAWRGDADGWEQLAASAHLEAPPPYRPEPGQPVYQIRAGEHVALVAEQDLAGPLRELVMAVVAEGWDGG